MNIDNQFVKRLKSLVWRAGMMGLAVIASVLAENLSTLELSPFATVVGGLVLGEISKYLNTRS